MRTNVKRSPGAFLAVGSTGDLTDMEVSAVTDSIHIPGLYARKVVPDFPQRLATPEPHYSAGRYLYPQVYVVGWRTRGVVKIGSTWNGRRRYSTYLNRGGELVTIAHYRMKDSLLAEIALQAWTERRYSMAFSSHREAKATLALSSGCGWTEFFEVPANDWHLLDARLGVGGC